MLNHGHFCFHVALLFSLGKSRVSSAEPEQRAATHLSSLLCMQETSSSCLHNKHSFMQTHITKKSKYVTQHGHRKQTHAASVPSEHYCELEH